MKYSVFHIEGGISKNIASTAIAKKIALHSDRKLIVVSTYPEVYFNNPHIYRIYKVGFTPYFYEDFVKDKDTIFYRQEPYFSNEHINQTGSLIQNWLKLYGLEYNNDKPELYFNPLQSGIYDFKWKRNKPILLIHTCGGRYNGQAEPITWVRDMPFNVAEQIANTFSKTHHILQVTRKNTYKISNAEVIDYPLPLIELLYLVKLSDKRLLIDSCLQDAAAALNKKSTVLWIGTSPKVFGYELHNNILPCINKFNEKFPDSYLFDYAFELNSNYYPYNSLDIFNIEQIIETLK